MPSNAELRRAKEANDKLTMALLSLAARGERTHCSDVATGGMWLSEVESERKEAVRLCRGCRVLPECHEVGKFQTFGVFGARDSTRKPRKKKQAAA
jgi:hypothetical protein